MGLSELWYLDLWLFMGLMFTGLAILFVIISLFFVALEGRKGWGDTTPIVGLILFTGWFWPVFVVGLPIIGIYRAVRNV